MHLDTLTINYKLRSSMIDFFPKDLPDTSPIRKNLYINGVQIGFDCKKMKQFHQDILISSRKIYEV